MSLRGQCPCGNFQLAWQNVDLSLVPRACQCGYCLTKGAAYVSKSGSGFEVRIHRRELHKVIHQGSGVAEFHECGECGAVVFVTAEIEGDTYGAINAACIDNHRDFGLAVKVDFSGQNEEDKRQRWQQNWCRPVTVQNV